MMKILSLLLFSLPLMACTSPHLEIFPKLEDPGLVSKQLTVEDMQDDIDALINGALARHPDLSSYRDINSIQKKASELKLSLNKPLTRTEFYKVVGQLNYLFEDGHSFLIWPYQEYSAVKEEGHKAFPLDVTLTTSGEIVIAKDYQSENETIEAGTVVTSINGVSIDIILDTLQQYIGGESELLRKHVVARRFPIMLWAGYGGFRFIVEYFREPDSHLQDIYGGFITQGQMLSLPMFNYWCSDYCQSV